MYAEDRKYLDHKFLVIDYKLSEADIEAILQE